jgi:hypothetical protein
VTLLSDLDGFYTEHRRCGELEAGVEGPMVWLACDCGRAWPGERAEGDHGSRD